MSEGPELVICQTVGNASHGLPISTSCTVYVYDDSTSVTFMLFKDGVNQGYTNVVQYNKSDSLVIKQISGAPTTGITYDFYTADGRTKIFTRSINSKSLSLSNISELNSHMGIELMLRVYPSNKSNQFTDLKIMVTN